MGLIVGLFSALLCVIVYVRMYRKDLPVPIGKGKAALPAVLGIFSPYLSGLVLALTGLVMTKLLGRPMSELVHSMVIRSLAASFFSAGFPEEITKFLVFLLVIIIVKPGNVYEYGMLCAGVGLGFTALEEAMYGGGNLLVAVTRIPTFALHMVFGVIMGTRFGLAKNDRLMGRSGAKNTALSLILPILFHTVFDASNTANMALRSDDTSIQATGVAVALAVMVISLILQFRILSRFMKRSEYYCGIPTAAVPETEGTTREA